MVHHPKDHKGSWSSVFQNDRPIRLEIGCGKGKFLLELANLHPELNFVGVEKFESVLVRAVEKAEVDPPANLKFLWLDAEELPECFGADEVDLIYLNFSDPWPKSKQKKRRLTHPLFLARYASFLKSSGRIRMKTDNFGLFMDSMVWFVESDWHLETILLDLHAEQHVENVETEFETRFVAMGRSIYYLSAVRPEETHA
jgi:tRNA (guanine-N7-)-methyltransferase